MSVDASELAALPLFGTLSAEERDELAGWFEERTYDADSRIVGEGTSGYEFFVLADGAVVVTSDGTELARLGPGDFFGEMAFAGEGRRNATVTATAPTRLFCMFGSRYRELQLSHEDIAARIEAECRARLPQPETG